MNPCVSKQDFKDSAQRWFELKDKAGAEHLGACEKLLDEGVSQAAYARLRINADPSANSTWTSREFRFDQGAICPRDLERECKAVLGYCQGASSMVGAFLQTPGNLDKVLASNYDLENSGLQTLVNTIDPGVGQVLTLGSDLLQDAQRDDARFAMSINSCAAFHGPDTATKFHHLNQRTRGQSSQLSAFLTGSEDCQPGGSTGKTTYCTVNPDFEDLQNNRQAQTVQRPFAAPLISLYGPSTGSERPNGVWQQNLARLTAYQSH